MLSQDYQDLKTINRSRFFIINGLLFRCLGLSKISFLFLENLIHLACQSKIKKDKDDFFLCTVSFLKNHSMPWTRNEQKRQIRKLIQMGYIETKTKASKDSFKTQYRWIKINVEKIKEKARTVLTTKKVITKEEEETIYRNTTKKTTSSKKSIPNKHTEEGGEQNSTIGGIKTHPRVQNDPGSEGGSKRNHRGDQNVTIGGVKTSQGGDQNVTTGGIKTYHRGDQKVPQGGSKRNHRGDQNVPRTKINDDLSKTEDMNMSKRMVLEMTDTERFLKKSLCRLSRKTASKQGKHHPETKSKESPCDKSKGSSMKKKKTKSSPYQNEYHSHSEDTPSGNQQVMPCGTSKKKKRSDSCPSKKQSSILSHDESSGIAPLVPCENSSGAPDFGFSLSQKSEIYTEMAERFLVALMEQEKVMKRPRMKYWIIEMRKLVEGLAKKRPLPEAIALANEMLDFHISQLPEPYHPKIYSAESFRTRWGAIVDAHKRHQKQQELEAKQAKVQEVDKEKQLEEEIDRFTNGIGQDAYLLDLENKNLCGDWEGDPDDKAFFKHYKKGYSFIECMDFIYRKYDPNYVRS